MHLPLGPIAKFAWKRPVLPAIGKAIVSHGNPLTKAAAQDALADAVRDEVVRQVEKRAG